MKNFAYRRVASWQEAAEGYPGVPSEYIAGGTELLNWMRLRISEPDRVIDIGAAGPKSIVREGDQLVIGALSTLNAIGENSLVMEHATVLSQACLQAASPQIRNRATIGGNVLQKTRCPYFRAESPLPWPCNKRQAGSGCAALNGMNERHALFGWTEACVAVHPSDPLVALACLDAEAMLDGPAGKRTLRMDQFHFSQTEARQNLSASARLHEAQLESKLKPGELITGYRIPIVNDRSAYVKVRERASYEYALVSAAATVRVESGKIAKARIALGSVAQRPWRLPAAEQALIGQPARKESFNAAVTAAMRDARPLQHNAYKIALARNAAVRALELAGASA